MAKDVTSPAGERRGYHHGNLREALLDAARQLIAEKGPQGFTLAETARLVAVSPAAPYRHFKDREDLIAELCRRGFILFGERLAEAAAGGSGLQAFEAMGRAYLAFARNEPGYYAAMFAYAKGGAPGDPGRPPSPEGARTFQALVDAVAGALTGQDLAGQDLADEDVRRRATQIWALSHGVATLERVGQLSPESGISPEDLMIAGALAILRAG